jgi:hypothetical protein
MLFFSDMASSADADDIPLGLLPAKRAKVIDSKKCLFCQVDNNECLRKASALGISAFLRASKLRNDDVYERIDPDADTLLTKDISWHGSCYKSYTSRRNLSFVSTAEKSSTGSNPNWE